MTMRTTVPGTDEVVRRAADTVPVLRQHAAWGEENRRLHGEVIDALAESGVFRLRVPERFGGREANCESLVRVATELGRGDGAAAWTASVYWIPTWMVCQFPDEVQEEVFSTPDVRVCGTLSPGGTGVPVDGGIRVNGRWGFISGAPHAHWQEIIVVVPGADGGEPEPVVALVPMSDLRIVDDWHTSGLRGSGSVATVAEDVFVPQVRVLPLGHVMSGRSASAASAGSAAYRVPLLPVAAASSVGCTAGMALGAREAFLERLPGRKITYTSYEQQSEAPLTHVRVAEAATLADAAGFHALRLAGTVDAKGLDGSAWSLEERARCRADLGAACRSAREAVDLLASASGGSSVYSTVPIQRFRRDLHAVNLHALMNPDTNNELYGRVLCGLEPNTLYV
ncbi:acyl-CoA dehydrogenase family protein [Nocardiopsis quinghaiensis]|uniref:acyl-CoA dehydrogenase family protein n=1 Tax=Nocardiopsis quinghaiensis TaxID=464995 RepID=UPI00123C4C16|nr:acyl-CoA dehydrogenase family protein [Nocardiopsis quinghaiensis]